MSRTLMEVFHPSDLPTRLERALAVLTQYLTVSDLERRLGLFRGTLGQLRPSAPKPKRPGRSLVLLLEVLARHPEELDQIAD